MPIKNLTLYWKQDMQIRNISSIVCNLGADSSPHHCLNTGLSVFFSTHSTQDSSWRVVSSFRIIGPLA